MTARMVTTNAAANAAADRYRLLSDRTYDRTNSSMISFRRKKGNVEGGL